MSQAALHPMLNIAIKAARAAGAIINRASLDVDRLTVTSKSHNDFVTEVDQAAEDIIIDTILAAYPSHGILAEESGQSRGNKSSEFVWIIDPLDGTTNFIHGFPVYAVSIALAWRGQVQQAVVYDPSRNDLFYASRGKGAYMNDRRLRVSKRTRMLDCLIGTGFPFRKGDNFQRYLKMFEEVMVQCAGVRRPGAAALDLCYVAAGFYDGFFETGLSPWDIAAGSLMITEAGGLVGNFTGESDFLFQREVVAGNPRIYGQLVQILSPYTRVIKDDPKEAKGTSSGLGASAAGIGSYEDADTGADTDAQEDDATLQALKQAEEAKQTEPKPVARKRITAATKAAEVAAEQADQPTRRRPRPAGDAPF